MSCRPRYLRALVALTFLAIIPVTLSAATYEVYPDGKAGYATIQEAVDAAREGDTVIVNVGTYTGAGNRDIDLGGKALTIQSSAPMDSDVVASTVIDCQGTDKAPHRGFVLVNCGGASLVGLTISNGLAEAGGAVYCDSSVAILSDCRIIGNATLAGGPGGGIYAVDTALVVDNCQINGNTTGAGADSAFGAAGSGGNGGGLYAAGTVVSMMDCTVADNATGAGGNSSIAVGRGGHGGGIYADSLLILRSTITGNTTGSGGSGAEGGDGGLGGGIYTAQATVDKCIIEDNATGDGGDSTYGGKTAAGAGGDGAGIFCSGSLDISDSLIAGNRCGDLGVGMAMADMSAVGGGIWCADGTIDRCTIVSNVANDDVPAGGGVYVSGQSSLSNSIVWDNWPNQLLGTICDTIVYCDIQDGQCPAKQGNLAVDPAFVQPGFWASAEDLTQVVSATDPSAVWVGGNYGLTGTSPCVDAGDPGYAGDPNAVDLAGRTRVAGKAIDMGAYETQALVPVYKFQSPTTGKYFFTASESEKDWLLTQPAAWTFLGIAYQAYLSPVEPGLMPVYRFWSPKLISHFWTISEAERDYLIDVYSGSWDYEGPVFYAYPEGSQPVGSLPVYRFWSGSQMAHYYTISETEKDLIIAQQSDTWTFEGIVWYTFDADSSGPKPPVTEGTEFEFAAEGAAASLEFELKAYLDGREVQIDLPSVVFSSTNGTMKMLVDFDAMTTSLAELKVDSDLTRHAAVITDAGSTGATLPLALSVVGSFETATARGPFAIDPLSHSFSNPMTTQGPIDDETFRITGAAVFEGDKYDIDVTLPATTLTIDGQGLFDDKDYPDRLDVDLDGPFQWSSQRQDALLLEAGLKGHIVQVYVVSAHVRPMGAWLGKDVASGEPKADK